LDALKNFFDLLDGYLGSASYFPIALLGVGVFFTFYLRFPQLRYFKHAFKITRGKYDKATDEGDTSHFQALTTALSGTVGTGNIGGVGLAIAIGGPAALFWMWATAFAGMTTKFVEVTLSHKYRVKTEDGSMAGGPMYYMERKLGYKWLAVMFAVGILISSFGTGNMPQINSIASGLHESFDIPQIWTGLVLAILLGMVIVGGISRIAKFTAAIVPFMAVTYVIGALIVIIANYENILPSFGMIFHDVFSGTAASGGFLGASVAFAWNKGVGRGLFSNEAGQGSAPIAHAAAKAHEPVSEGMVSILEPFIDTIIICTLTGLVILSSGVWTKKYENEFQRAGLEFVSGVYDENVEQQRDQLYRYYNNLESDVEKYNGTISVQNGKAVSQGYTILNSRSFAEKVVFSREEKPFNGELYVQDGLITDDTIVVTGHSLLHSVRLTAKAFSEGFLGKWGEYVVTLGLLLFAFSTAIAWSYYGDRAVTYLFGSKGVMPYRVVYILGFFLASFMDTQLIWKISAVAIAMSTLPNLLGIMLLHKDMKQTVADYWKQFKSEYPDDEDSNKT
jgi:AGCS family alanine or glycine:cation symporter